MQKMYIVSLKNIKQYKWFQHWLNNKKCSWAQYQHIRLISEGSQDTENWSDDCWKFSFAITEINNILRNIKIEKAILNCNNTSQYYYFYCNVDQIKTLVSIEMSFKNITKLADLKV